MLFPAWLVLFFNVQALVSAFPGQSTTLLAQATCQLDKAAQYFTSEEGSFVSSQDLDTTGEWSEALHTADGISVWTKFVDEDPDIMVLARARLRVAAKQVYSLLLDGDPDVIKGYNTLIIDACDVEALLPRGGGSGTGSSESSALSGSKISWSKTLGMGPIRCRDFLTKVTYKELPDGAFAIMQRSQEHKDKPPLKGIVRGEIKHGIIAMRPHLSGNASGQRESADVILLQHFHIGGYLPTWLVNRLAVRKPVDFLRRLETLAAAMD